MTIGLKSVENPLEFGIVVTDEDGRVERFLEKPSWGQVFSDTINTGIYVLEPEVLRHIPTDRPYDFSKELFPLLLEMGRPIYGYVCDGYWQDIGNLDQYRQANFDALDEKVRLNDRRHEDPRRRLDRRGRRDRRRRGRRGPGVHRQLLHGLARVVGRPVHGARPGLRRCASADGVSRTVIDASCYIGRSAVVEGAILGRNCDVRAHARVHEGVAIGDQVTLGDQSVVYPGVRIYPYKEVEYGAQIHESLIWESRGDDHASSARTACVGLVNVDLTPEVALRFGAALGTALQARRARRREPRERAGLPDDQARDHLGPATRPASRSPTCGRCRRRVGKHLLKTQGYDAAFHVGSASTTIPRRCRSASSSGPGVALSAVDAEGDREALHAAGAARASRSREVGAISYPARARESYASDLLAELDVAAIRGRGFRIVVDYGYSAGELRAAARPRPARRRGGHRARVRSPTPARAARCACARRSSRRRGLVAGDQRRLRRGLRPLGRADLPDRRDRARGAARPGAPALPAADGRERRIAGRSPSRSTRRARSRSVVGDEPRGRPHPGVAAGADAGRGRGGRDLRRRGRGRLRLPGASCRPTTRCASLCKLLELLAQCERAALRARRRAAAPDPDPPRRSPARGR